MAGEFVLVVFRLIRFVGYSIKSCDNLWKYACKKGVPVMRGERNSGFSLRVNQESTLLRTGSLDCRC